MLHIVRQIEERFPEGSEMILKVAIAVLGLGLIVGVALLLSR